MMLLRQATPRPTLAICRLTGVRLWRTGVPQEPSAVAERRADMADLVPVAATQIKTSALEAWYVVYSRKQSLFTSDSNCVELPRPNKSLEAVTDRQRRQIADLLVTQMVVPNDEDLRGSDDE
jgi:hypothetical protein